MSSTTYHIYLTPEQKDILRHFFSNFNEEHNTELKRRFIQLWSHIGDIYHAFNQRLADQGLAYEGALYREVAELQDIEFEYETYIFVGFNLLQKVEQNLFLRMKNQGQGADSTGISTTTTSPARTRQATS